AIKDSPALESLETRDGALLAVLRSPAERLPEEQRSKQPTVFSLLRSVIDLFRSTDDIRLGLYGAFGYDLALQFEPLRQKLERPGDQRDLVLSLPDELVVVDHRKERAMRYSYEFDIDGRSTKGLPRTTAEVPYVPAKRVEAGSDHAPGEYARGVEQARA